ncbi:hypothetical protein B0H67DRAFT_90105 [Lasiosphaeris hirsuta]|uniref:Uncharacterized protein n=1 Tax=Lasiosphaeris hirsuta TaxID=260670 RepID=A0AA40EB91_9PEZI|nr:hypothetical protein B0H67DRAFT_90105 [Lasiosphaeris hirsuta]
MSLRTETDTRTCWTSSSGHLPTRGSGAASRAAWTTPKSSAPAGTGITAGWGRSRAWRARAATRWSTSNFTSGPSTSTSRACAASPSSKSCGPPRSSRSPSRPSAASSGPCAPSQLVLPPPYRLPLAEGILPPNFPETKHPNMLIALLAALPPLEALRLAGGSANNAAFDVIVDRRGGTLRTLALLPKQNRRVVYYHPGAVPAAAECLPEPARGRGVLPHWWPCGAAWSSVRNGCSGVVHGRFNRLGSSRCVLEASFDNAKHYAFF